MASPTLPSDIITNILTRLPSKPLIRFKSVSKQWYSLINSPNFINLHLTKTLISKNSPNLIIAQHSISSVAISDQNNPNFHSIELHHPLKHLCKSHNLTASITDDNRNITSYNRKLFPQILGSINGVVCISMYDKSSVVLYNPSTKTHRFIPPFTPSPNTNPHSETPPDRSTVNGVVFGFGFDSVSGDYKVLRMIDTHKNSMLVYREASVYSLKNDSWKCVRDQTMMGQFILRSSMVVCFNEVLHFIVVDTKDNCKFKVKCFNLRTETFSIFELPEFDVKCTKVTCVMSELGGCFSVLVNYQNVREEVLLKRADLWVMKEYGNKETWYRLFSIRNPARLEVLSHVRPLVYSADKKRVLLELDGLSFGWYSWGSKSFEKITVHGLPSSYVPCETWTFVDSLVSIGKHKDVDSLVSIGKHKDSSKPEVVPKKNKNKRGIDYGGPISVNAVNIALRCGKSWIDGNDFLSSGFKLRL